MVEKDAKETVKELKEDADEVLELMIKLWKRLK